MNFLEKDLETIIWENYEECVERGLAVAGGVFVYGKRYRQMNLMPYGIADLVNVYHDPVGDVLHIQVIECKRGKVDAATYLQAKRYLSALREIHVSMDFAHNTEIRLSCVLIGSDVDTDSDLAHVIHQDLACTSYVYKYGVDGIHFDDRSVWWWASTSQAINDSHGIEEYVLERRYKLYTHVRQHGDFRMPLLITADGILLNTDLLEQ